MLKKLLIPLLFSASCVHAASIWQGNYVGAYFGGGFGYNHTGVDVGGASDSPYFATQADINAVNNSGTAAFNPNTFIAGVQAGENWARKKIVYGLVMDYGSMSFAAVNSQNNISYPDPDNTDQYSMNTTLRTRWLFTLRARLGYALKIHWPSLLYVTGGAALTHFEINDSFSDISNLGGYGNTQNNLYELGWAAGLGVDIAAVKNWFWNVEYLYVDMPSINIASTISNATAGFGIPTGSQSSPFSLSNQFHANLLKVALSYHFNA